MHGLPCMGYFFILKKLFKIKMKNNNKKITVPKIYLVERIVNKFSINDFANFDAKVFLKNIEMQESFFKKEKITIEEILFYIWLCRYPEKELISSGEIEEDHLFFKRILKVIDLNPDLKDKIYEFCTFMCFEDNSICNHWNFKNKIEKKRFDNIVVKSLYAEKKSFNLFLNNLSNEDFKKIRFVSKNSPEKQALDIKSKIIKDILFGFGAKRTSHKKLLELIDTNLKLKANYNLLLENLDKSDILYYPLKHVNISEFNNTLIEYKYNGILITTTVENLAKHNSMVKGLSECMTSNGYGLDGKIYSKKQFGELVNHFNEDQFLKKTIVNLMNEKAKKAVKKENKTIWQYYAVALSLENKGSGSSSGEKTATKRLKI